MSLSENASVEAEEVARVPWPDHVVLEKMGVMFVGGREAEMPVTGGRRSGGGGGGAQTQIAGQAMVRYRIAPPSKIGDKLPVIMVPGMGLTSSLYLSTPDEREGWATTFAKAGHPVSVIPSFKH